MYFLFKGGGLPKSYSGEGGRGGQEKKIGNWGGGVIQFSNYTPPNSTSPPYPIKNERSLSGCPLELETFLKILRSCLLNKMTH